MVDSWLNLVPKNYAVFWLIMFIVVIAVLIKVVPKVIKVLNNIRKQVNNLENLAESVKKNTENIELINQKIGRDYARLNSLEKLTIKQQQYIDESLEERELILRSLLGVVQGLQEIGANGPTKKAEADIQEFLLKKFHQTKPLKEDSNE